MISLNEVYVKRGGKDFPLRRLLFVSFYCADAKRLYPPP